MSEMLYEAEIAAASHLSLRARKGTSIRLIDKKGNANLGMLFYNPENLLERYNAPDTLKCQHTFKLSKGNCLYSDMGRIFCSIVEDSVGWHETILGNTSSAMVKDKWGERGYQDYRNEWYQNGHDSFLVELAKYGLGKKDMASNVNLFSQVTVSEDGSLEYVQNNSKAGDYVELRFEMDTLVIMHTCPHPMNPANVYPKKPIVYQIRKSAAVMDDDFCKNYRPENQRGFENNRRYLLGISSSWPVTAQ